MVEDSQGKSSASNRKPVVLFVDDSPLDRAYIEGILIKHDFAVLLADHGDQAIKIAKEKMPDLILLDILLPQVSGIEVCKQIKADKAIGKIPIIFFTSIDTPKNLINYAGYGAVDYLHKSIPTEILVEQIRSAIESSR